jgi:hypothetical protein
LKNTFFINQSGKKIDWDTRGQVLKEKFYLSEYLEEIVKEEHDVQKQANIAIEEISQHQSLVGTGVTDH